jgi:hypothetical protein
MLGPKMIWAIEAYNSMGKKPSGSLPFYRQGLGIVQPEGRMGANMNILLTEGG